MIEFLKGFLIYVIIWFVILFTILPIGVKVSKKTIKGNAPSAPENPPPTRPTLRTNRCSATDNVGNGRDQTGNQPLRTQPPATRVAS